MFGKKKMAARLAFSNGIMTTFGKLNQRDIEKIEGQPARLVSYLIELYGWNADYAQAKVDRFCNHLLDENMRSSNNATQ